MFTTEEILQIAKKTKSINAIKSVQKWPQECPIQTILENDKNDMPDSKSSSSDSDCIIVAARSQYLKLKMAEKVAGYAGSYVIAMQHGSYKSWCVEFCLQIIQSFSIILWLFFCSIVDQAVILPAIYSSPLA